MTGEPDSSTTRAAGWRVWLPAVLLATVAVTQIVLAHTADLSPWKGGGFGMFATIDGTGFRHVRILVEAPTRFEELEIAPSQDVLAARAKLFPSNARFLSLARSVAAREKRYDRPVQTVTLEVWRTEFNQLLEATDRPLRAYTWNVDQPPDRSR